MQQARRRLSPGCGGGRTDAYGEVAKKQRRTHAAGRQGRGDCRLFSSEHYRFEAANESSYAPLRRHRFLSQRAAVSPPPPPLVGLGAGRAGLAE